MLNQAKVVLNYTYSNTFVNLLDRKREIETIFYHYSVTQIKPFNSLFLVLYFLFKTKITIYKIKLFKNIISNKRKY